MWFSLEGLFLHNNQILSFLKINIQITGKRPFKLYYTIFWHYVNEQKMNTCTYQRWSNQNVCMVILSAIRLKGKQILPVLSQIGIILAWQIFLLSLEKYFWFSLISPMTIFLQKRYNYPVTCSLINVSPVIKARLFF